MYKKRQVQAAEIIFKPLFEDYNNDWHPACFYGSSKTIQLFRHEKFQPNLTECDLERLKGINETISHRIKGMKWNKTKHVWLQKQPVVVRK